MKLKQISFKIISMVMVFAMMFGMSATTITAVAEGIDSVVSGSDKKDDDTIKYVSIGDSMTNGYGFDGYNQDQHTVNRDKDHVDPEDYNFFDGTGVYGEGSYANQFANWLELSSGKEVEHTKLAMSAFRAEDLNVLLGLVDRHDWTKLPLKDFYFNNTWAYAWNGCEDYVMGPSASDPNKWWAWCYEHGTSCGATGYMAYHVKRVNNYMGWYPDYNENNAKYKQFEAQFDDLSTYFTESLLEADIISLALGSAAFDAYFMDRLFMIWEAVPGTPEYDDVWYDGRKEITLEDVKIQLCESDMERELVQIIYDTMLDVVAEYVPGGDASAMQMDRVCQLMTYVMFSHMHNYKNVIEWIGENNSDAEIMIVGILNSHNGLSMNGIGETPLDMGAGMAKIYVLMDTYIAGVAADYMDKNDDFTGEIYFVEQPENAEMIATVIDELDKAGWGLIDCGNADCENCGNGKACPNGRLDGEIVRVKTVPVFNSYFASPMGYWYAGAKYTNGLISSDMELLAMIQSAIDNNLDALTLANMAAGAPADSNSPYWTKDTVATLGVITASAIYLACEQAMIKALESGELELDAIVSYADGTMRALLDSVDKTILPTNKPGVEGWADTLIPTVDDEGNAITLKYIYDYFYEFYTSEEMLPMMRFLALNKVGNGIAAHPTPSNHDRLAANMIAAYQNGYTVQDKCEDSKDLIVANEIFFTLMSEDKVTMDQVLDLIDAVVDAMLAGESTEAVVDIAYDTLVINNVDDATRLQVVTTVYRILVKNGYLKDYEDKITLIEDMSAILDKHLDNAQLIEIVDVMYDCLADFDLSDEDQTTIIKVVYEALMYRDLYDSQRIAIIGEVYSVLEGTEYLNGLTALDLVEKIYIKLHEARLITDSQSYAIVDYVYENIISADKDMEDETVLLETVVFVYNTIVNYEAPKAPKSRKAATGYNEVTEAVNNGAKALRAIVEVLVEEYVDDAEVSDTLATLVTADGAMLNDAALVEIGNAIVGAIEEGGSLEFTPALASTVVEVAFETIQNSSNIDEATKGDIIMQATVLADKFTGGENNEDNTSNSLDFAIVKKVYDNLKAKGLLTGAELMAVINVIYPVLNSVDELTATQMAEIVAEVYDVVFDRDELSLQDKIDIVYTVYQTLEDEGYVSEKDIVDSIKSFIDYIKYDYADAYKLAYNKLVELGYVELVDDYLAEALCAVEKLADEIEALDLDATLDTLKADLLAAIDNVAADIAAVRAIVASGEHSDAVENLNKLLNKLSAHVDDATALCDDLINVADVHARATVEAIKAKLEDAGFNADTFAGELVDKAYDYLVEMHGDAKKAYAQFVAAVVDEIYAYSPVTAERVEELLNAAPEAVHAFFAEYGDEILDFVTEYTLEAIEAIVFFANNCADNFVDIMVNAGKAIANGTESLFVTVVELSVKYGTLAYEFAKAYVEALDLNFTIDAGEFEEYLTVRIEAIFDIIEEFATMIETGDLEIDVIYNGVKDILNYVEELKTYIVDCADITLDDLLYNKNIIISAITEDLRWAVAELDKQIKDIELELDADLADLEAKANAQIDRLVEIAEGDEDLEAKIAAIRAEFEADAKALRNQAEKQIRILEGKIQDQIDEFNANREENIEKLVKCVGKKLDDAFKALDKYIFDNYSVVDIELNNKSDLVSIGGQNSVIYTDKKGNLVVDDHYASILAGMFEGGLNVQILHDNNLRVSDLLAILDKNYVADEYGKAVLAGVNAEAYRAAIKAAELITLDFGVEDFTTFAFAQLIGFVYENYSEAFGDVLNELAGIELGNVVGEHKTYEMDWSRFGVVIDQDVVDYILDYVYDLLEEQGVDTAWTVGNVKVDLAEVVTFAFESYLYAIVNYSYNLEAAIEAIHAINPDAAVMVLGSFNFLDDIKIPALAELDVDLGAIASVFVKVVDLQTLANVAQMDNTYYVYVGGAETVIESGEDFTYLNLININDGVVSFNSDLLDASEAGHKYIAEQLFAAITGKYTVLPPCQHEYDDCEDVDCNLCGEIRRAPGHTYEYCTDDKCAVCGKDIEPTEHEYSNCTDTSCYKCKYVRKAGAHTYDGCLDTDCNVCGYKRVAAHTYKEVCSEKCMLCSHTRVTKHTFGEWVVTKEAKNGRTVGEQMRTCEICGKTETRSLAFVGLGGGAIAAIVSGSVVVAGAGGFSVFWFVVKKKSFADLVGVFKSLTKKAQ